MPKFVVTLTKSYRHKRRNGQQSFTGEIVVEAFSAENAKNIVQNMLDANLQTIDSRIAWDDDYNLEELDSDGWVYEDCSFHLDEDTAAELVEE